MQNEIINDLQRSGLTEKDARAMKLQYMTADRCKQLLKVKHPGYKIPYFDIKGKPTKFYRTRLFATGFEKAKRYRQPEGTDVRLYFPPIGNKWVKLALSAKTPIYITEGEKKAYAAMKRGLLCIGLGGVWSWQSKKKGVPLIPDFSLLQWQGRTVYIVFDSDIATNEDVRKAADRLSDMLKGLGAVPSILQLPVGPNDSKVGLDDWLLNNDPAKLQKLSVEEAASSKLLWKLNEELAVIVKAGGIYHTQSARFQDENFLAGNIYAQHTLMVGDKPVNLFRAWQKWPQRRLHDGIVYEPGKPGVTADNSLNTWKGWGTAPAQGNIKPWNDLMEHLFKDDRPARKWFEQWAAYPIQNPGTKLYTAVLLWSRLEGTGKSLVGYILGKIYGSNFAEVSQEDLSGDYNAWAQNKQFVMGEELTGSDRRRDFDRLKHMVTRAAVSINAKYQPHYEVRDCINYLLTSNNPNALYMGESDRRFFVHEVAGKVPPKEFFDIIDRWYKSAAGPAALMHHLLRLDLSDFNPHGHALRTASKVDMQKAVRSPIASWCADLRDTPDEILRMGSQVIERDLFKLSELWELLPDHLTSHYSQQGLYAALRRTFPAPRHSSVNHLHLWAVRNVESWSKKSLDEWVAHYSANGKVEKPKKSGKVVDMKRRKVK